MQAHAPSTIGIDWAATVAELGDACPEDARVFAELQERVAEWVTRDISITTRKCLLAFVEGMSSIEVTPTQPPLSRAARRRVARGV